MSELWERVVSLAGSNHGLKVLALVIAVGLWLAGHRDIERAIEAPVEFRNIPSDLMVMDNRIDYVVLRLMGPRTLVSTLDAQDLRLYLDLSGAKPGSASYPLDSSSFAIPRGISVARITPPVVHLRLEPLVRRTLPVALRFSNKPPAGFKIAESSVVPQSISAQGPAEDMRRLIAVETFPIEIEDGQVPVKRKVRLSSEGKPLIFTPDQVEVSISLEEEQISKEFSRVDVRAKQFAGDYRVNPSSVYLRLAGPVRMLSQLDISPNQVYLDLTGLKVGEHSVPLNFSLPPQIKVLEQKPQRFKVRITKTES